MVSEHNAEKRFPLTAPVSPDSSSSPVNRSLTTVDMSDQATEMMIDSDCVSQTDYDYSTQAVIRAAESGDLKLLDDAHDKRLLLSARDERGMTPLLAAVWRGSSSTVSHLATLLGDGYVFTDQRTVAGMTCLHLAAERRATSTQGGDSSVNMLTCLLESFGSRKGFPSIDERDKQGCSALHVACMFGDVEAARWLLRHGADPAATMDDRSMPLHWAAAGGHAKVSLRIETFDLPDIHVTVDKLDRCFFWPSS